MFPRPEVNRELARFIRVRFYTDGDGELFQRQQKMQQERFGTVALPYYAILPLRFEGDKVDKNVVSKILRFPSEFHKAGLQSAESKGAFSGTLGRVPGPEPRTEPNWAATAIFLCDGLSETCPVNRPR